MKILLTEEMKEEILKLGHISTYSDALIAYEIAREKGFNVTGDMFYILGCLYKYGKIQGIREERAKRKNKKALANDQLAKATI